MIEQVPWLSETTKTTLLMRAFGMFKVPLLFLCSPRVIEISDTTCKVLLPFRKIVKNHLGSMYFGALAIGADTCVGMLAIHKINKTGKKINLIFKSFKADFVRRAEGDTLFVCDMGVEMDAMIERVVNTGERVSHPFKAQALVNGEVVAEFVLELSLKLK